jgi:hypothetical protein
MEFLFEEDPYYPLAVAFRRHHTAGTHQGRFSI